MTDNQSKHLLVFEAQDCNDPDWDKVIEVLREQLPDFEVFFADGNNMNFRWN